MKLQMFRDLVVATYGASGMREASVYWVCSLLLSGAATIHHSLLTLSVIVAAFKELCGCTFTLQTECVQTEFSCRLQQGLQQRYIAC